MAERTWGPILVAIEEGHYARTPNKGEKPKCGVCQVPFAECKVMNRARADQARYAENLRLQRLVSPETRRTYV